MIVFPILTFIQYMDQPLLITWIIVDIVAFGESFNMYTHSKRALKASGCTSKMGIGSFLSAMPPKNIASKTGDAIAKTSLWPLTTTWCGSVPTRNVQSDHCPDWRRCAPLCFISVHPNCQSLGAPAIWNKCLVPTTSKTYDAYGLLHNIWEQLVSAYNTKGS